MASDKASYEEIRALIRHARPMTPEDWEEQRRSFAHGQLAIENPRITRAMVDRVADRIARATAQHRDSA